MKKAIKIVGALLLIGIVYLAIQGSNIQTVTTEIEIAAPPSKVWNILIDINQWQEWNPTINASQGYASPGSTHNITMIGESEGTNGPKYNPKIIKLDKPNYFHWRAHMLAGFIFTNDKTIELKETSTGTKIIHSEIFKGMLVPLFSGQMNKGVPPILNAMNKALKERAEQ